MRCNNDYSPFQAVFMTFLGLQLSDRHCSAKALLAQVGTTYFVSVGSQR